MENETRVREAKNFEQMDATSNTTHLLPDDVFFNMFKYLPAKSLMRFKSVCKSWLDMISHPLLVESRFHSDPLPLPDESHIFFFMKFAENLSIFPTNLEGQFSTEIPTHMFSKHLIPCTEIVNGFVCLLDGKNFQLYMFNVYSGEKMPLPSLPKRKQANSSWRELFAMGFDPLTNQRKVLLLYTSYIRGINYIQEGKILTFGTNIWREVKFPTHIPSVEEYNKRTICLEGIIYWMGRSTHMQPVIECFNVGEEEFGTVALPSNVRKPQLAQIRGTLAIWCSEHYSYFPERNLWILNNANVWVRESRFKRFGGINFRRDEYQFKFVGARSDDEILFAREPTALEPLELVFYDLGTGSLRTSKITSPGHPRVVVDMLSLASVADIVAAHIVHVKNKFSDKPMQTFSGK